MNEALWPPTNDERPGQCDLGRLGQVDHLGDVRQVVAPRRPRRSGRHSRTMPKEIAMAARPAGRSAAPRAPRACSSAAISSMPSGSSRRKIFVYIKRAGMDGENSHRRIMIGQGNRRYIGKALIAGNPTVCQRGGGIRSALQVFAGFRDAMIHSQFRQSCPIRTFVNSRRFEFRQACQSLFSPICNDFA